MPPLPLRSSLAVGALQLSNRLSRMLGRGSGTVAGGRVGLALDPALLRTLTVGRRVALVSGTNGKTTTTRLLAAALTAPGAPAAVSNLTGANLPAGHVAALAGAPVSRAAVLEVDEGYLGQLIAQSHPELVVLLNLSRDQLDRIAEVRMLVDRWRIALAGLGDGGVVVANADDPMVVWAASTATRVVWVGAGQVWHSDAVGCPSCGGRIEFDDTGNWACDQCSYHRPTPVAWLEGPILVSASGARFPIEISLPGQFNRANAVMVAVAASTMAAGDPSDDILPLALSRMATVDEVAGRFASTVRKGHPVRLLLAKNPAGWTAIFDLLDETRPPSTPVVLSINARVADGLDASWLWDVPFERLQGRTIVATGDRRRDLAVRLRYAEVTCTVVTDPLAAVDRAIDGLGPVPSTPLDFLGNYTAFADLRARL
jgi:UDP-N-acetylmuramyl tripeptide synthase